MENDRKSGMTFPAKITRTKKGHWYITIPTSVKGLISWEKKKVFKITIEKF